MNTGAATLTRLRVLGLGAVVLALAGCATTTSQALHVAPVGAPSGGAPSDLGDPGLRDALGLLYKGDASSARKLLLQVLKRHPADPTARDLIAQIDTPPEDLLGSESFSYRTRADDTLSLLAERYLSDPLRFYALARYNHLATAGRLEPGLVLRIPGHERPATHTTHQDTTVRVIAPPAPSLGPHVGATTPTPQGQANPQRASQLRAAALEQMNWGAIDRAVTLLEEAKGLDPANALIQRDLERALRISRAVHAKS